MQPNFRIASSMCSNTANGITSHPLPNPTIASHHRYIHVQQMYSHPTPSQTQPQLLREHGITTHTQLLCSINHVLMISQPLPPQPQLLHSIFHVFKRNITMVETLRLVHVAISFFFPPCWLLTWALRSLFVQRGMESEGHLGA